MPVVAVPDGVVTAIGPVVAAAGTVAWIWLADTCTNTAAVPLKVTAVAPPRFTPLMVTILPVAPDVGEKEVIRGADEMTVKFEAVVEVPVTLVMEMGPVVAPMGTVVVNSVGETSVKPAEVPLNFTEEVLEKFEPTRLTSVPTMPEAGEKLVIEGGGGGATTVTVAFAKLLAGFGSEVARVAVPELGITVPTEVAPGTFTTKVRLREVPLAVLPAQVPETMPVPPTAGAARTPLAALADTKVVPAGVAVLIATPSAASGPPLAASKL